MTILTDYINQDLKPLDIQESIANVQDFFLDVSFSHFPVLEEGVFIGNVSGEDIENFDFDKKLTDYKYSFEGFFTRKNAVLLDVLDDFAKNETNVIPVLDSQNNYVGYYELEDIVKIFNDTPFLKELGGIIMIEKDADGYSFSQISQIVEGNNGKLLGIFISALENNRVQITLKISGSGLNDIIQTFRRYEYDIISEHQEDDYIKTLKERSDYLDKYLNI
jgi:predicted transcriptional regulator